MIEGTVYEPHQLIQYFCPFYRSVFFGSLHLLLKNNLWLEIKRDVHFQYYINPFVYEKKNNFTNKFYIKYVNKSFTSNCDFIFYKTTSKSTLNLFDEHINNLQTVWTLNVTFIALSNIENSNSVFLFSFYDLQKIIIVTNGPSFTYRSD